MLSLFVRGDTALLAVPVRGPFRPRGAPGAYPRPQTLVLSGRHAPQESIHAPLQRHQRPHPFTTTSRNSTALQPGKVLWANTAGGVDDIIAFVGTIRAVLASRGSRRHGGPALLSTATLKIEGLRRWILGRSRAWAAGTWKCNAGQADRPMGVLCDTRHTR